MSTIDKCPELLQLQVDLFRLWVTLKWNWLPLLDESLTSGCSSRRDNSMFVMQTAYTLKPSINVCTIMFPFLAGMEGGGADFVHQQ